MECLSYNNRFRRLFKALCHFKVFQFRCKCPESRSIENPFSDPMHFNLAEIKQNTPKTMKTPLLHTLLFSQSD